METGDKEYQEGRKARREGKVLTDNPYQIDAGDGDIGYRISHQKHHGWIAGWRSLSIM